MFDSALSKGEQTEYKAVENHSKLFKRRRLQCKEKVSFQ